MNVKVGALDFQLRLTPQAARPYARTLRQIGHAVVLQGKEYVVRMFARGDGGNLEIGSQLRRQVFQTMDGQIDAPVQQRLFNLLGEHSLGADLRQRHVEDLVARRLDNFELDLVASFA